MKRFAQIPATAREELDRISKADLMEIAFHLALRLTGKEDEVEAYEIVANEYVTLALNQGRRVLRLSDTIG